MKKEYRSDKLSYNVWQHGNTYVPDFGVCCPECSSSNVSVVNEIHALDNIEDCKLV